MNVLVIEPDRLLGETYVAALIKVGHQASHSRGAQSAIRAADKQRPDAVVLELQLPGHSGFEFMYEFRSYPEWQDIPIILHTLVPDNTMVHESLVRLKVTAHLYKPSTRLWQLVRAVNEVAPAVV